MGLIYNNQDCWIVRATLSTGLSLLCVIMLMIVPYYQEKQKLENMHDGL